MTTGRLYLKGSFVKRAKNAVAISGRSQGEAYSSIINLDLLETKFLCLIFWGSHNQRMFSHVVIFWTDPNNPKAADELIAGVNKYLKPIPGVLHYHVGKMAASHRPVVDQTYQVALNLVFPDKKTQDDYQIHPMHLEFVEGVFKKTCKRVVVYDFE